MAESSSLKKKVVMVGVDTSNESFYSLEWTMENLLAPTGSGKDSPYKLILVHVKIPPLSVLRFSGPGISDSLNLVEADLKKTATNITNKAKELCEEKSISDYEVEILEGDARTTLCEAVEKHHVDILVMGAHAYGTLKRTFLGSVSDYCAHHAHCSVLIVKKPKSKH
ncbi:hypothetical protein NE237_006359 [Protea cynaroides]|uniref:UspA domain-containing protein n=1 Tax=Protea cynaroides TaxID=273540 RepID=A0A9Q0QVC4_9MAGN|nr:hypothetical protein NE237_006359 [Protea cynaroides]